MPDPFIVTRLRCEYLVDPLGIDETAPRLSWELQCERRGARQVAYRILVASTAEELARRHADRWDSGRIESGRTTQIVYEGSLLRSRDACHWIVEVTDETGTVSRSAPAFWTMGLLSASDWTSKWIAAAADTYQRDPQAITPTLVNPGTPGVFARTFETQKPVRAAILYASARGLLHLKANGRRVTPDLFAPEWTDYDKRIQYRAFDVTALLRLGQNRLEATLGDGWWSGYVGWQETRGRYGSLENSLLLQLELEFVDGSRETVATDSSWLVATGPILSSDFMMGEVYDARRAPHDGSAAREVAAPTVPLVAQRSEPVRVVEELTPVAQTEIKPGVVIYDLGQNIAGFVRLRVRGVPAGTRVTIRHGERLNPDGTLYTENLRRAKATDVYIARGEAEEVYEPHFTFHGFQYVELTATSAPSAVRRPGFSQKAEPAKAGTTNDDSEHRKNSTLVTSGQVELTGLAIQSTTPPAGRFECSHAGVNRLWLNSVWSQRDNFLSVPTDCPQRDERLGWMGDAQVFLRTASYNADVAAFFTKWMVDVEDAQTADGVFPDTAPRLREGENFVGLGKLGGSAGWADAGVIIPYTLWQVYGDLRVVERHWTAMVKWVDWIDRHNSSGLRLNSLANNYGDWLCIPSDTSFGTHSPMKNLLATAFWADDARKLARMGRALGRDAEAARFEAVFQKVRAAFQREWLREDGRLAVETQTAYLLALAFDLLPAEIRSRAAAHLVEDIRALDWHLSTGFIGISHLNPQLTLAGHAAVAYRLLLQDTYPSWLYPVKHGATTIWERWNGWTHADGFFNPQMNSFNHYSLGSVGEWLFRHVAGIEVDPEQPGFQHFTLRPYVAHGLTHVRAQYRAHHGRIDSAWRVDGRTFAWSVGIPANCSARVSIPCAGTAEAQTDNLPVAARDDTWVHVLAPAGRYDFKSTLPANITDAGDPSSSLHPQ